ncbi:MAG: UDP-N-acetylmuramate--alanine ligase [Rhodospirillales bacterium]|nr:UDP-N-acetylmuramate--alanine ligase [Alphaproteobacteria bacterium]USO03171.1 MAG: UDP-N-acetylmuramate--alanine ligase [Rhodospirillales bacterium]
MTGGKSYFFCGIGGSGMLPLALIVHGQGAGVSGSDRSYDQGKNPEKFEYLEKQGIALFPQDGSGLKAGMSALVVSTAVEDHIPDIKVAKDLGIPVIHRARLLADLFNGARTKVAVAGTSGKTTVTGMTGFALQELGRAPTVMNGGIFRNYSRENPYGSALVGAGEIFVTEADESDGSIALYEPDIAVLNNVALDHKPLEELKPLFETFLKRAGTAVVNFDNEAARLLAKDHPGTVIGFGLDGAEASLTARDVTFSPDDVTATILFEGQEAGLKIGLPGRHNLLNALAAIGALAALGISLEESCAVLARFTGIRRRMELVGCKNGVTVMDDFAHNPDKIAATLQSLRRFPGRKIVFFQPHGYGFLKQLHMPLAGSFSAHLDAEDVLYLVEPYYAGGTVDRSIGSKDLAAQINGPHVDLCADREEVRAHILSIARGGDRIIVMGARDDTLSDFAREIYAALP